jgi:predicted ATPase
MTPGMLPIRSVAESPDNPYPRGSWPATLAPVRQVLDDGFEFGEATVLIGDNGAGKSTLIEGIALAYGLAAEGGSTGSRNVTRPSESELFKSLWLTRTPGASKIGYFLRAETMHGFFTYLENNPGGAIPDPRFHEMSHGESFLELISSRFRMRGLYVLDEPESALSFSGCLALVSVLKELLAAGDSQVILSTHSPLLAALPGATIYEVGDWGLRETPWDDLPLVQNWKSFLDAPERFLRYL